MILFSGFGLALSAFVLKKCSGEYKGTIGFIPRENVPISQRFQVRLFIVTAITLMVSYGFNFSLQSQSAIQNARVDVFSAVMDISETYKTVVKCGGDVSNLFFPIGESGFYGIFEPSGKYVSGYITEKRVVSDALSNYNQKNANALSLDDVQIRKIYNTDVISLSCVLFDGNILFVAMVMDAVYEMRDIQAYETMLADILLFSIIFLLISLMIEDLIVDNLTLVNKSLHRITRGDLDEKVQVYSAKEFTYLSNDINEMVTVLKGYIDDAAKRIEEELVLARTIQSSALPKNFNFNTRAVELFATMDPAKEVGGDFYDFFFVDINKIALVIADVSGKGIPGALFMMHSKTVLRGLAETETDLAEIFEKANNELCQGNDAEMFVTVWMGVVDLKSGVVKCINAGHEYPVIRRLGEDFELLKEKHSPPLATLEGLRFREYEIQLEPGDSLFVYTDGIPEAINNREEAYGYERMIEALNNNEFLPLQELLPAVKEDIDSFVDGADQFDDITMLGFKYHGLDAKGEKDV
jgi:hypothetical protein